MKITIAEPTLFKECIYEIENIIYEANFLITPECIKIAQQRKDQCMLVVFTWKKESCEVYEEVKEKQKIGLSLVELKKILKRGKAEDKLEIDFQKDKVIVTHIGNSRRSFKMPIIVLEEEEKDVPKMQFSSKIKVDCREFIEKVEDCFVTGESISIEAKDKSLRIYTDDEGMLAYNSGEIAVEEFEGENCRSKFAIEFLQRGCNTKVSDKMYVYLAKDYPLMFKYVSDKCELKYLIAPVVNND